MTTPIKLIPVKPSQPQPPYSENEMFTEAGRDFAKLIKEKLPVCKEFIKEKISLARMVVVERAGIVKQQMPSYIQTTKETLAVAKKAVSEHVQVVKEKISLARMVVVERAGIVKQQMPSYIQTTKETLAVAKKAVSEHVQVVKEKIPVYQEKVQLTAHQQWDKLSPTNKKRWQLVFSNDAGKAAGLKAPYKKNAMEEIGDWMLFPVVELPKKVVTYHNHPIVVGALSIKAALFAQKLFAYPIQTLRSVIGKIRYLPRLTYFFAQVSIVGLGLRSVGRMTNPDLMNAFNERKFQSKRPDDISSKQ